MMLVSCQSRPPVEVPQAETKKTKDEDAKVAEILDNSIPTARKQRTKMLFCSWGRTEWPVPSYSVAELNLALNPDRHVCLKRRKSDMEDV